MDIRPVIPYYQLLVIESFVEQLSNDVKDVIVAFFIELHSLMFKEEDRFVSWIGKYTIGFIEYDDAISFLHFKDPFTTTSEQYEQRGLVHAQYVFNQVLKQDDSNKCNALRSHDLSHLVHVLKGTRDGCFYTDGEYDYDYYILPKEDLRFRVETRNIDVNAFLSDDNTKVLVTEWESDIWIIHDTDGLIDELKRVIDKLTNRGLIFNCKYD